MPFVEILKMNDGPSNDFDIYTNEYFITINIDKKLT
jgi:hypothetical protein